MRDIPNYLDDPSQILFWEADEFILLAMMFGVGLVSEQLTIMVVFGFVLVKGYRQLRDRRANGFMIHMAYWYTGLGSLDKQPASRPLPFIRRFF